MNKIEQLKQENTELKEKIKKYSAINEQETKDYAELKNENIMLKKELQKSMDNYVELDLLRVKSEELHKKSLEYWQNKYSKLYQIIDNKGYFKAEEKYEFALQKIKNLAKCGYDMYIEHSQFDDFEKMTEWMKNQFMFILDETEIVND